jgi:HlyD family secretion protein
MKKRTLFILIAVPLIFILIPVARMLLKEAGGNEAALSVPVVVSSPRTQTLQETLAYSGTLEPARTIPVISQIPGKIRTIHVEKGQNVSPGDLLISMDRDSARLQSEQAEAAWQASEAQYRKAVKGVREEAIENARALVIQGEKDLKVAETNLVRTEQLFKAGAISKTDFEDAENKLVSARTQAENAKRSLNILEEGAVAEDISMAKANADAALKQYELTQLRLEYSEITSPISGTVAEIFTEDENMVGINTPILLIIQDNPIKLTVSVPEKHYHRIQEKEDDLSASVIPIAYQDLKPFTGNLINISSIVDPVSRTFSLEFEIENSSGMLRPGMYVNTILIIDEIKNALTLPARAVVTRNNKLVVFTVRPSGRENGSDNTEGTNTKGEMTAQSVPVEIGLRKDETLQVLSGVDKKSRIIVEGNSFLEDGQKIRIIAEQ